MNQLQILPSKSIKTLTWNTSITSRSNTYLTCGQNQGQFFLQFEEMGQVLHVHEGSFDRGPLQAAGTRQMETEPVACRMLHAGSCSLTTAPRMTHCLPRGLADLCQGRLHPWVCQLGRQRWVLHAPRSRPCMPDWCQHTCLSRLMAKPANPHPHPLCQVGTANRSTVAHGKGRHALRPHSLPFATPQHPSRSYGMQLGLTFMRASMSVFMLSPPAAPAGAPPGAANGLPLLLASAAGVPGGGGCDAAGPAASGPLLELPACASAGPAAPLLPAPGAWATGCDVVVSPTMVASCSRHRNNVSRSSSATACVHARDWQAAKTP